MFPRFVSDSGFITHSFFDMNFFFTFKQQKAYIFVTSCWNIGVKMERNWKVERLNIKLLNFDLVLCELKKSRVLGSHIK